jgi:hypothetical protein
MPVLDDRPNKYRFEPRGRRRVSEKAVSGHDTRYADWRVQQERCDKFATIAIFSRVPMRRQTAP